MKHPFQNIEATSSHIFTTVKNHLQVFEVSSGKLVGEWVDDVNSQDFLKKQQLEKIEKLSELDNTTASEDTASEEPEGKRAKTNKKVKIPKIPVPGPGAPPIYNYIRGLQLTSDGSHLIGITDSDKSIIIFQLDFNDPQNCLTLINRQVFPKRPCSISLADDNQSAIIGDKFGDVYKVPVNSDPPVAEKDHIPILGHVSMLTQVLMNKVGDKQYILTSDRDEHIKVSHYPQTFIVNHWLFGHEEFISQMVVPDFNNKLLITGGGDEAIYLWNWYDNKLMSSFPVRELIDPYLNDTHFPPERFMNETSIREISVVKIIQWAKHIVVLFENVKCLLALNINDDLSLSLNTLLDLNTPLIDMTLCNDMIIGCKEPNDNDSNLLEVFKLVPELTSVDGEHIDMIDQITTLNPCNVSSRDEFYPLYTVNSLRKRSEH